MCVYEFCVCVYAYQLYPRRAVCEEAVVPSQPGDITTGNNKVGGCVCVVGGVSVVGMWVCGGRGGVWWEGVCGGRGSDYLLISLRRAVCSPTICGYRSLIMMASCKLLLALKKYFLSW